MTKLSGLLRLTRPANIVTAIADVLAGVAIAGYFPAIQQWTTIEWLPVLWLILSTTGLYGGGVVFNDVFDARLDSIERPERPIPRGVVTKKEATLLGVFLLLAGIFFAVWSAKMNGHWLSGIIALVIALAALVYDKWGKHHAVIGPLNMGLCRGLNLLLGMSILPMALTQYWFLGLIPLLYIAAVTMISRGEVHGSKSNVLFVAAGLYVVVITCILFFSIQKNTWNYALFFLLLFSVMIFFPLQRAILQPSGARIGKAVKAGVMALILLNAAWAAAFSSLYVALLILLLLPLSILLASVFSVT